MHDYKTYEQYPGHYASNFASDFGYLASIVVSLPDIDDELIVDIIENSLLVERIEEYDSPSLADSSQYTWFALLMREERYQNTLGKTTYEDYRHAAMDRPTRWDIWWAVESIIRIAQIEGIRAKEVISILSFDDLRMKYFARYHTLPFSSIYEVYQKRGEDNVVCS